MKDNAKLLNELSLTFPNLYPGDLSAELYQHGLDDRAYEVNKRDGYRLIGYFDSLCSLAEADYFAFADTLAGAMVYSDFIPGSLIPVIDDMRNPRTAPIGFEIGAVAVEIGMLRKDFLKLEQLYSEVTGDAALDGTSYEVGNSTGLLLISYDPFDGLRLRQPVVKLSKPEVVEEDGVVVFGNNHLPLHGTVELLISIFDGIPDDYDLDRFLFYRMKKLNEQFDELYDEPAGMLKRRLSKLIWSVSDTYNDKPHENVTCLMPRRTKFIPLSDLFPVRKVDFGPVQISVPNKTTTWVYEDAESLSKQVKCLQEDVLDIAKEIDRICRKHDIGYFVCGGTMLGLVRHGGFIPWDDDMDVGMLRADYEKFMKIAANELEDRFFLQTRESDPNIPYLFSKVRLKDSEYITAYNELRDFNKGICVDIFPFDRMPLENGRIEMHIGKMKRLARAHNKVANRQVPKDLPSRRAANPVEVLGHAVMKTRHAVYWNQSLAKTQAAYHEAAMAYNDNKSLHYVASYVPTFTCVHLDDLLPYRDIEFEGAILKAPANPEVFLQMQYGDFMTAPMPHQQRGHGLLRWKGSKHCSAEFEDGGEGKK